MFFITSLLNHNLLRCVLFCEFGSKSQLHHQVGKCIYYTIHKIMHLQLNKLINIDFKYIQMYYYYLLLFINLHIHEENFSTIISHKNKNLYSINGKQ